MNFSNFLNLLLVVLIAAFIVRYFYLKPKFINGEKAPEFTADLIDGTSFSLSDLKGQYVLLDFWGSWCGPCRQENPKLKAFQENNAERNLEVVSIAIETNPRAWKAAIEKDKLNWKYHIGQFENFDSEIAKLYGVREIPTKYLINPEGFIVGVNMDFDEMDELMKRM